MYVHRQRTINALNVIHNLEKLLIRQLHPVIDELGIHQHCGTSRMFSEVLQWTKHILQSHSVNIWMSQSKFMTYFRLSFHEVLMN
jgi:DNA-directed RNA polymerase subunit N (RpoN/RPB10)